MRYFDGFGWTEHRLPPPPAAYAIPAKPAWRGAAMGLPAEGPGALADPGRRLTARVLDVLVLLPFLAGIIAIAATLVIPHVGPIFPSFPLNQGPSLRPVQGIWLLELVFVGCIAAFGLVTIAYETVATARYGRTLGKRWLRIRPVRSNGRPIGVARSLGRVALYCAFWFLNWIGLIDVAWCLWDQNHQCLHDKACDTIVINDPLPTSSQEAGPAAVATGPGPGPSNP